MNFAVQLLPSLTFRSCLLFSFQGDTFHLLKGLIETNTSILMRLFRVPIRPANWLFPNHIIYFSIISRLSGEYIYMSELDEFSRHYMHKSFCVPAKRWEVQKVG